MKLSKKIVKSPPRKEITNAEIALALTAAVVPEVDEAKDDERYEELAGRRKELIAEALTILPENERAVIEGRFYEGLSLLQISKRMGYSWTTIKTWQTRGLDKMRNHLIERKWKQE